VSPVDVARIRGRVGELLAEYRIPSAAVAVLHDGETTELAVGVTDVRTGEPATTDTVYQCGSLTKTWTALAFLQLVDEGRVGLDEPVRTHLPGFRVADARTSAELTPRHLLNHTNGIEEDFGDPGEGDDVLEHMVENIADAPQVAPLGRTHGYSAALGYAVLARIMEVVDDRPWDRIMRERLFDPLGLTATTSRPDRVDPDRGATGHLVLSPHGDPVVSPVPHLPRAYGPGGGVCSTAGEALALARIVLAAGGGVLSPATAAEMTGSLVPVPDPYPMGPQWALGLVVGDWNGETVYASDGSTIGQHCRLRILPGPGTAVALLTNAGPREGFDRGVFDEVLADLGLGAVPDPPRPDPTLDLDPTRYEGAYERPGTRYEVRAEGGELRMAWSVDPVQAHFLGRPERIERRLLPLSTTQFLMPAEDPLEDDQTVAIYDVVDGVAQYLHTNCRVSPRR
jgi:CubicO group peptidase (beta-lactamase class C family)